MAELREFFATWLDPQTIGDLVVIWGARVLAALAIFLIGRLFLRALGNLATNAMRRVGLDDTLSRFLGNLLYTVLLVFLVLTALTQLGVNTLNFVAIVGAAGLAIGLALKDSLANFSSGVMLVFFRPFQVGDYVEVAGTGGTVETIGIFNVILKTADNRVVHVPNRLVYGGTITNVNCERTRRIDLLVPIGYDADIPQARSVIGGIVAADKRIHKFPSHEVVVQDVFTTSVVIAVRAWVDTSDYGNVRSDLLENIKRSLDKYGLAIPLEQRALTVASATASK